MLEFEPRSKRELLLELPERFDDEPLIPESLMPESLDRLDEPLMPESLVRFGELFSPSA